MSNIRKGSSYYITRSKSIFIDNIIICVLAIFMTLAMQMDSLQSRGDNYLLLMLYTIIFGLTSLQASSMVVDLTAKDKLSRRIEFFIGSGIDIKEIIKNFFYFNLNCIFASAKTLRSKVKRRHEERVACGSF